MRRVARLLRQAEQGDQRVAVHSVALDAGQSQAVWPMNVA